MERQIEMLTERWKDEEFRKRNVEAVKESKRNNKEK